MNKPLKHKSSTRTIKTNKSSKIKESSTFTSRTPVEKSRGTNFKKNHLHKFKSIPVISYAEGEQSQLPS